MSHSEQTVRPGQLVFALPGSSSGQGELPNSGNLSHGAGEFLELKLWVESGAAHKEGMKTLLARLAGVAPPVPRRSA